jgi:hypothetical protein
MLFDARNEMFLTALRQVGRFTLMENARTRMTEGKSSPFLRAGWEFRFCLLTVSLLFLGGCALLLAGGATGTLQGFEYSLKDATDKSFATDLSTLKNASVRALKEMAFQTETPVPTSSGFRILAAAPKLDIQIDLERVTERVSRISVNAKKGFFRKDRATAVEIIRRTGAVIEQRVARAEPKAGKFSSPLILMVP